MTEMSGLLRNILPREVVFLNSKSGHNPESRMAAIWGESQRVYYVNRGRGIRIGFHSVKQVACGRKIRPVEEEREHPGQILPRTPSRG
jgi:hypothetical protein